MHLEEKPQEADDLIQQDELMSDDVDSDDDGSGVLGTSLR